MSNEYPPLVHCLQKRPPQRLGRQPVLKGGSRVRERVAPPLLVCKNILLNYNSRNCVLELVSVQLSRASDISRGRGPAKFRHFREIPRNSPKNAKYREIRQKYFQIHVGKTYLILILFYSPQMSKFILKLRHCNE